MRALRFLFVVMTIAVLATSSLPASAQAKGPDRVGIRPDAPDYAKHGPYWVGTRDFKTKTNLHRRTVTIWYPVLNLAGVAEKITYRDLDTGVGKIVDWEGYAIANAVPDLSHGPYPLVIFAHGWTMVRFNNAYLTEHVASHGFVVLSIDYEDSSALQGVDSGTSHVSRPKDVTWQIDYAEMLTGTKGPFQGLIDTKRIAIVGHSYGGYTALMAGGAQLDITGSTSACVLYPNEKSGTDPLTIKDHCNGAPFLLKPAGLQSMPDGLWPSWGDSRVSAIVPLAPLTWFGFGSDSFKGISVPALLMVGSKDDSQPMKFNVPYAYDKLGSGTRSLVLFEDAGHSIFTDKCEAAPYIVKAGNFWLCSDPVWDMDRAHDLINHLTTAFLLDVLKGDKDAHKALLPDAVKFPGIAYKTTMK